MFQSTVNRNYTAGFPGDILNDGPLRAKPARIASATLGTDPGASTNRISRAFGYSADMPLEGTTEAALEALVEVGGENFFGILFNRLRYVSYGTQAGGSLAASLDLPQGADAEFTDMVTGLCVEVFNFSTAQQSVSFGNSLAYVPNTITAGDNPLALPYGALVAYSGALPTGLVAIPNARVTNSITLAASAAGELVSGYTRVQLTQ